MSLQMHREKRPLPYLAAALIALLCLWPPRAAAQTALGRMEIGVSGGGMNYIGDLNGQSLIGTVNVAGGAFFRMRFSDRWAMVAGASYGHVESRDYMAWRNLSFRTTISEAYLRMEFNFWPEGLFAAAWNWTPYLFGGLGVFAFNPRAQWTNPLTGETAWHDLQPLGTEGQGLKAYPHRSPYSLLQLSMPFGLGVKLMPNKKFTLAVEYGFRKSWTDYLDDVSTTYVDNELLRSSRGDVSAGLADRSDETPAGTLNASGIKRGDDSLDDWYAYFNVSIAVSCDVLFGWMRKKNCDL